MPEKPPSTLSPRERSAFLFYERHVDKYAEAPTFRALAEHLGIVVSHAHYIVARLRQKGYLTSPKVTIIRSMPTAKGRRLK